MLISIYFIVAFATALALLCMIKEVKNPLKSYYIVLAVASILWPIYFMLVFIDRISTQYTIYRKGFKSHGK